MSKKNELSMQLTSSNVLTENQKEQVTTKLNVNPNSIYRPLSEQSFLYTMIGGSTGDKVLYTGLSADARKRISQHLHTYTQFELNVIEWFVKHNLQHIYYIDVSHIVQEKAELRYLEQLMIDYYEPTLNKNNNRDVESWLSDDRIEKLDEFFKSSLTSFVLHKEYRLNRQDIYNKAFGDN